MIDLLVVALAFGAIFVVELPDKTFIATLVLSTKFRPLFVWIGVALAFLVQTLVAVGIGKAASFLPDTLVHVAAALMFLVGALILLREARAHEAAEGEEEEDFAAKFEIGAAVNLSEIFTPGQIVDAQGTTRGRGFSGVVRRWSFAGFVQTHGTHEYRRHGGSIGTNMTPGRTLPNLKMPGQYGNETVSIQSWFERIGISFGMKREGSSTSPTAASRCREWSSHSASSVWSTKYLSSPPSFS